MVKEGKYTNGVFTDIIGTSKSVPSFEQFINQDTKIESINVRGFVKQYRNGVEEIEGSIKRLALLETIIMQMRCKENVGEIKLSVVRNEYIYARCPFYRPGNPSKDLRVVVGKLVDYSNFKVDGGKVDIILSNIIKDPEFMEMCKTKLINGMKKIISKNVKEFKSL
jgi:hypothetical protein